MPEVIDGFTVFRSSLEEGEGNFYPAIDVEMLVDGAPALRSSRTIHSEGVFRTRAEAEAAAGTVQVLGVVTDGNRIIIKVDAI
ncbi:hypothetical protein [Achromobacter marplatensis]|uniref:hypothetical protein n=1 Tax=Achromobacter marplatensis TaxID=470868 RepID=UPI0028E63263|nr:hypothetical protein [Achromobacter marplatensis]